MITIPGFVIGPLGVVLAGIFVVLVMAGLWSETDAGSGRE